ncbi:YcaO-like family protein [Streptomyces sp. NPDC019990]|uniref:YcaO-like family protein n=1 Tax=Streptomyces sp. NPDC019990 TaxID=3154693 RepID=UPI0033D4670C
MIDVLATLAPEARISRAWHLEPPGPGEPLWRGMVQLAGHPEEPVPGDPARPFSHDVVGAYGVNRSDVLVRAAGEAVERYALRPLPEEGRTAAATALDGDVLDVHEAGLGADDPGERVRTWYSARRLLDGHRVWVPAGLVDHPTRPQDGEGFDPGPSGAAAGAGSEMALRSALLEVIERDALTVAWARALALPRIDPDASLAAAPGSPSWRSFGSALRHARAGGWEPVLAEVPTAVDGVTCVVGILLGDQGAAVGCNASTDPGQSLAGALQEALQVMSCLRLIGRRYADQPVPGIITEDTDRARWFASPEGRETVRRWCDGFLPRDAALRPDAGQPSTEHLLAGLHAQGARPLAVDLTHRLPAAVRVMGWAVVKVIPAGLQPLRIDERCSFGWNHSRLETAETRTGLRARSGCSPYPHPLI